MSSDFVCLECGKLFRSVQAAERAADRGCPECGSVDIDLNVSGEVFPADYGEEDYGGAFDGFNVTSDADPGL